jgi:hypothetical protein
MVSLFQIAILCTLIIICAKATAISEPNLGIVNNNISLIEVTKLAVANVIANIILTADFNEDGWNDIAFMTSGNELHVSLNQKNGSFTVGSASVGPAFLTCCKRRNHRRSTNCTWGLQ